MAWSEERKARERRRRAAAKWDKFFKLCEEVEKETGVSIEEQLEIKKIDFHHKPPFRRLEKGEWIQRSGKIVVLCRCGLEEWWADYSPEQITQCRCGLRINLVR